MNPLTPYDEIPKGSIEERMNRVTDMIQELLGSDVQGVDREQHLLTAEGLLVAHGRMINVVADMKDTIDAPALDFLLKRAALHIELAGWRA